MERIDTLNKLVADYTAFALKLRKDTSDLRSLFGPRTEEINHPGHGEFDAAVESWVRDLAASQPGQEVLDAALEVLLFCALDQQDKAPYWYLTAIQRHGAMLIPLLEDGRRDALAARYTEAYPPRRQVPSQTQIHKLLAPGQRRRKPFFSFR